MIYKFASGFRMKTDPQVVGDYLDSLHKKHGHLDTRMLLEDAKRPDCPVHSEFTWDDAVAANEYRNEQARYILCAVVAVIGDSDGEQHEVRAFVNVGGPGHGHTPIQTVLASPKLTEQLMEQAIHELIRWRDKYAIYKELSFLVSSVERIARPYQEKLLDYTVEKARTVVRPSVNGAQA